MLPSHHHKDAKVEPHPMHPCDDDDGTDFSREKVSREPLVEDASESFLPSTGSLNNCEGEERRPVAPGRKTRKRSKGVNEICHAQEPTNSSHETEAHTFVDENIPETVEESFLTHRSSPKEEIINEAMSEEVERALGQKREAQAQEMQAKEIQEVQENKIQETQKEEAAEANLKASGSTD